jgi:AP endonuclease-1
LYRGYIGLHAFHHILTDPRVQGIPLVLETPSFELPETVWKKEIEVLNQLSEMELGEGEGILQEMKMSVEGVVEDASGANSKTGTTGRTRGGTKQGKSKKADVD